MCSSDLVNAAMMALPEDLRQAITLREIEGMSYEDIAQLKITSNCVHEPKWNKHSDTQQFMVN